MKRILATLAVFLAFTAAGSNPPSARAASCPVFTRSFGLGASGSEIKALQQFLNGQGSSVALSGPGSAGLETSFFGAKTRTALAKWQAAHSISPAAGYFGPLTRAAAATACRFSLPQGSGSGSATSTHTLSNPTPETTSTVPVSPAPLKIDIPATEINPGSIVGVLCTYRYGNDLQLFKGSGVIVNQQGFVLTARHLIDPKWTLEAYNSTLTPAQKDLYANAVLDHCEVGLPSGLTLPSPQDIQTFNPSILITRNFQYVADPFFLPSRANLSDEEYHTVDIAVLKISSATQNCSAWNTNCDQFGKFPYTPVLSAGFPQSEDQILSYGYPSEAGINHEGDTFYNFYLKGAVGTVGGSILGNTRFFSQPIAFAMEANDIQGGRSGSPVFWKGKVIGILYGSTSTQESFNVPINIIISVLKDAGYGWILATE